MDAAVAAKKLLGDEDTGRYWLESGDSIQPSASEKILWREAAQEMSPGGVLLSAKDNLFKERLDLLGIELTVASIYNKKKVVRFNPGNWK